LGVQIIAVSVELESHRQMMTDSLSALRFTCLGAAYAAEYVPRPPAAIPYKGGGRCIVNLGYGRWGYCN
jgi:hypothetical protein